MVGTFSQQLASSQQQQQSRLTRTQRKVLNDEERRKFDALREQANQIRQSRFSNITSIDQYRNEYNQLSPEIRQFFLSPDQIQASQQQKQQEDLRLVDNKIQSLQNRINENNASKERYIQWFNALPSETRDKRVNDYYANIENYERTDEQYKDEINFLSENKSKIEQGASGSDVIGYAISRSEQNRTQLEYQQSFNKKLAQGTFNEDLIKLGFTSNVGVKYDQYQGAVEKYNQNVAYMTQLQSWAGKEGYAELPSWAREKLNPQAEEWQKKNPTEILKFDEKGNVIGVISGEFGGQEFTVEGYNKRINDLLAVNTSLKLGGARDNTAVMSGAEFPALSQSQQDWNEMLGMKTPKDKAVNWIKDILGMNKEVDTSPPPLEYVKTWHMPKWMGGHGTSTMTDVLTPESTVYVTETANFQEKANQLSEDIFKDYETKLNAMTEITQENVHQLKLEEQAKFNEQIGIYNEEFSKNYELGTRKIRQDKTIKNFSMIGLGGIAQKYIDLKNEEFARTESVTAKLDLDTDTFTLERTGRAKELFGNEQERQDFSVSMYRHLKDDGYPSWMAKDMVSGGEFAEGTIQGAYQEFYEHPKTSLVKAGAWTTGIAVVTIASTYTGGFGGVATSKYFTNSLKVAGLLYGGSIALRTLAPETYYERGKAMGTIILSELAPMMVGGIAGTYIGGKAVAGIDYAWYKWIKKYPYRTSYKFVEMDVLRGKQRFSNLKRGKTQKQVFKEVDDTFLTPDERAMLKKTTHITTKKTIFDTGWDNQLKNWERQIDLYSNKKVAIKSKGTSSQLRVVTHATSSRMGFKEDVTQINKVGREINAMSVSNKRFAKNFWDIDNSPKFSAYSGQGVPTASAPLGLRIDVQRFGVMPRGYHPKIKLAELKKILGQDINPKYFRYTAYLYEKGAYGTSYSAGRLGIKSEIENYLKGGGDLARISKQKYYTGISSEKYYQSLTGFRRYGHQEYAWKVEKFSIIKPSTWIDKILGRQAGQFKPMRIGRVVPIQRFEALPSGDKELIKQINARLLSNNQRQIADINGEQDISYVRPFNMRGETNFLLNKKGQTGFNLFGRSSSATAQETVTIPKSSSSSSSIIPPFKISASYPSSYAVQYLLLSKYSSARVKSPSYAKSFSYSAPSSLTSSIKSLIDYSSPSSSSTSGYDLSLSKKYEYPRSPSSYSINKYTPYRPPRLPRIEMSLKGKIKSMAKFRKTPEIMGLFPDFTARAIGLAPKQVGSVKQALREIAKIQTGFEIRSGARVKGFKPIDERSLMKGIF